MTSLQKLDDRVFKMVDRVHTALSFWGETMKAAANEEERNLAYETSLEIAAENPLAVLILMGGDKKFTSLLEDRGMHILESAAMVQLQQIIQDELDDRDEDS